MAKQQSTRGHVSGFVKNLKENHNQRVVTFRVANQRFVLPELSTFATAIRLASICGWNVLVFFENEGRAHPRVTGVIQRPLWAEVSAASKGWLYDEVNTICQGGRPL